LLLKIETQSEDDSCKYKKYLYASRFSFHKTFNSPLSNILLYKMFNLQYPQPQPGQQYACVCVCMYFVSMFDFSDLSFISLPFFFLFRWKQEAATRANSHCLSAIDF